MKKKRIASVLLLLAVVLAAVAGIKTYVDYQVRAAAEREYESLAELARETEAPTEISTEAETEETEAPYVSPIQFDELRKINPDIVGWLKVEGTEIDYPIVQTGNNETYLNTDFEGKKSVAGAIYLDYESEPDFSGRHNIIYGHNMKNGSMFKDIVKYKDEEIFQGTSGYHRLYSGARIPFTPHVCALHGTDRHETEDEVCHGGEFPGVCGRDDEGL